jgi:methionyl-tRNA synthetase
LEFLMTTYVTVAIPYANASPHLGYAIELVEADVFARALHLGGEPVRFLGGTDDYSLKNVLAAEAANVSTRDFIDAHAARFAALGAPLGVSFDDFIQTSSDPRHRPGVERLWRACAASGDLYRRPYEGAYCVGCEQFYDADEFPDGVCPDHATPLEHVVEENWFFRLARYQDQLIDLIASGALSVEPAPFRDEVLSFMRRGLRDVSVSRSVERARGWGIGVPDDPTQVVYVWFDALTNYISALRFHDPASSDYARWWAGANRRVHFIGKGILRFHAVYWPAFLLSAGQPVPTHIHVHPYLTIDGVKLSKSSGTQLDPLDVVAAYGTDALRWWLCRDVSPIADTDYTSERLVNRANDDLANGAGNAVNRIVTLIHRYRNGVTPCLGAEPLAATKQLRETVLRLLARFDRRGATQALVEAVGALNRDLETTQPWSLAKQPEHADTLDRLLDTYLQTATIIAVSLAPIVPELSRELTAQLSPRTALPPPTPVFKRLEIAAL